MTTMGWRHKKVALCLYRFERIAPLRYRTL